MENFDFDKSFADKLNSLHPPDFSEEDWSLVAGRLDARQQKKWRVLPLWWLGALSGLFLLSNGIWYWLWNTQHNPSVAASQHHSVVVTDTIYKKVVVYQYDTIYQTLVIRSPATSENPYQRVNTAAITSAPARDTALQPAFVSDKNNTGYNEYTPESKATDLLPALPIAAVHPQKKAQKLDLPIAFGEIIRKNKPGNLFLRPLKIGAGGGLLRPTEPRFSEKSGYSTAVQFQIPFRDHLEWVVEAQYSQVGFKGIVYDPIWGFDLPPSPGDQYQLKYFETDDASKGIFQASAGMRYRWLTQKKLSIFAGLGYAAQWHLPYEMEVEYIHKTDGSTYDIKFEAPGSPKIQSLGYTELGLTYRIGPNVFWQNNAHLTMKPDAEHRGIPGYWGLKSVLIYAF